MKVYLPNSAYLGNIDGFLRHFDTTVPGKLEITTHDKWINVHPAVLALVASLGMKVGSENVRIDDVTASSGHYLERMGLFSLLGMRPQFRITEHEAAGRFVPLTVIKNQEEQTQFITDMIPLLHLSPEQADAIKYTVGELLRNVLEHAESSTGAVVAAQYYPKSNTIRIGICDSGVGVRKTISQSWRADTDADALHLALMPGVTGTTRREGGTDFNAGAGLFFIKSMAMVGRNYFFIYSGSAAYKLLKRRPTKKTPALYVDPWLDKHSISTGLPYLEGTLVGVDISLEQTEQFKGLLVIIRQAYAKAVRERRKERFKRPQFL